MPKGAEPDILTIVPLVLPLVATPSRLGAAVLTLPILALVMPPEAIFFVPIAFFLAIISMKGFALAIVSPPFLKVLPLSAFEKSLPTDCGTPAFLANDGL